MIFYKKIILLKIILILLLITFPQTGYNQVYPFANYSVRQGLVNSNVYAMVQDKAGYIWLGTENGLSRFDGINFKNYTLEQLGLKTNISSLAIADDKNIILGSGSTIYKFNSVSQKLTIFSKFHVSRSNQLILNGDVLLSLHENRCIDFLPINGNQMHFQDEILSRNCDNKATFMLKLKNEDILIGRSDGLYKLENYKQYKINIKGLENIPIYSICEYKNILYLGSNGVIFKIVNNHITDTIHTEEGGKNMVRNINVDNRGNLWYNVWGLKDIYMISNLKSINVSNSVGIINGTITGILLDSSGSICVSSLGSGIYIFNNSQFLVYPASKDLPNLNIRKIELTKQGILLGTVNGLAYLDRNSLKISSITHGIENKPFVRDIISTSGNEYLVAIIDKNFINTFSQSFHFTFGDIKIRYSHCSSLWSDSIFALIGNWDNQIIQYRKPNYQYITSKVNIFNSEFNTHRLNCFYVDAQKNLWIGSQKGLCIINIEGIKLFPTGQIQNEEIFKIIESNLGEMLVVSDGGLTFLNFSQIKNTTGNYKRINIQGTNCVAITGKNEYLVGTSNGLLFIKNGIRKMMTIHDGILSENINDILYEKNSSIAWVATTEGLMQLDMKVLRSQSNEVVEIRQITFTQNDSVWVPLPMNNFTSNAFNINFQAFNYNNPKKIKYQYKIDDSEWLPTLSNEIQFASMEHGNHVISLRAGLSDELWGRVEKLNIFVFPPFYKTWWFYTLIIILAIILTYFIAKWQIKNYKLKQEEKIEIRKKIVDLQQKALASNLNPHFIFNSLNAIQHFINSKSVKDANAYLTKFARLMRMHLNMAENSTIMLSEEIHRLEFYLTLEQMRFDEKLKWSIYLDAKLEECNLEIPNMIIQPFVENAIWHGIMPSDRNGFISLTIEPGAEGRILITILDNGVGLNHKPKIETDDHESKGIRLIRERLILLDNELSEAVRIDNMFPGTRIQITLTNQMFREVKVDKPVYQV